jgi:hypothetical protein
MYIYQEVIVSLLFVAKVGELAQRLLQNYSPACAWIQHVPILSQLEQAKGRASQGSDY